MNEKYKFTIEELQSLYKVLEKQFIDQQHNPEGYQVVDRISRIVNEHDRLVRNTSSTT